MIVSIYNSQPSGWFEGCNVRRRHRGIGTGAAKPCDCYTRCACRIVWTQFTWLRKNDGLALLQFVCDLSECPLIRLRIPVKPAVQSALSCEVPHRLTADWDRSCPSYRLSVESDGYGSLEKWSDCGHEQHQGCSGPQQRLEACLERARCSKRSRVVRNIPNGMQLFHVDTALGANRTPPEDVCRRSESRPYHHS